jgi:hypothetical protein
MTDPFATPFGDMVTVVTAWWASLPSPGDKPLDTIVAECFALPEIIEYINAEGPAMAGYRRYLVRGQLSEHIKFYIDYSERSNDGI